MGEATSIAYNEQRLKQALQLNAEPLSPSGIVQAFGLKESDKSSIEISLLNLVKDGFAMIDKKGRYSAVNPMSDLAIARVGKIRPGAAVPLELQGVGEDLPFPVTLSPKQIRKLKNENALNEGDLIAVTLWRYRTAELKARYIGKCTIGKTPTIVGHFTRAANHQFVPHDSGIKTIFTAIGEVPKDIDPRKSYWASIPSDFDPLKPTLQIGEQRWDPDTGTPIAEIVAKKHGVQVKHPMPARAEAKLVIQKPVPYMERRDLTHEQILVIDPPNAKDHDDGILIQRLPDGFRTLVVISDIPYYVRPESELDRSARNRAFTHYFPDETYHMFPKRLADHASLRKGTYKPVIYVEQFWDESGNLTGKQEIGAGVIASQKQMTYGQFDALVEKNKPDIWPYTEFGDILIEQMRHEKGLVLDTDELNNKSYYASALVSAMMIEANSAIAEHLLDNNIPFLTRAHSGCEDLYAFHETREKLEQWGYDVPEDINYMNAAALNQIINDAQSRGEKDRVENLIRSKFLSLASYSTIPHSHFGLNREHYAHATSPIRRYGDVLALRGVHTTLGNHELGLSDNDMENMRATANILNAQQDMSRRISQDMLKYYATRDLLRMEGHMVRATLSHIGSGKAELCLPERFGLKKTFDTARLSDSWSERRNTLIFKDSLVMTAGAKVRVTITNVRPHEAEWDFENMEPVAPRKRQNVPSGQPAERSQNILTMR